MRGSGASAMILPFRHGAGQVEELADREVRDELRARGVEGVGVGQRWDGQAELGEGSVVGVWGPAGADEHPAWGASDRVWLLDGEEPWVPATWRELGYTVAESENAFDALATLERFIKLHPASPALDYAIYLKGIINFNDDLGLLSSITRQDLSERDQKAAKDSFESFSDLVTRFPDSRYAKDSAQRMTYIVNSLAQYEVHVARYYYGRGAYLAAVNRAQAALADYRAVPALEEAMFIVYKSYDALGMAELRDDARKILDKTYPNSEYLTRGFKSGSDPWWKLW